jgi:hypothetical protein
LHFALDALIEIGALGARRDDIGVVGQISLVEVLEAAIEFSRAFEEAVERR